MNRTHPRASEVVCVVDRSPMFAEGLRTLAEGDGPEKRSVAVIPPENLETNLPVLVPVAPSVVFMDTSVHPEFDSFKMIDRLRIAAPNCQFVLVLRVLDYFLLSKAILSEVGVMVARDDSVEVFRHALDAALMKSSFLSHSVAKKIGVTRHQEIWLNQENLSGRELDVLIRLGMGRAGNEIAHEFGLSPKTVGTYRSRLLKKLGLRNNAEICFFCLKHFPDLLTAGLGYEPLPLQRGADSNSARPDCPTNSAAILDR